MKSWFMTVSAVLVLVGLGAAAFAQSGGVGVAGAGTLVVKALAEKKVAALPAGPLFWRVERFASLAQAQAAAGPLSLAAESGGAAWLFTLGPAGAAPNGGTPVAAIGPLPSLTAPVFLLRVNEASGAPGSITPVHSHPGAEAVYVLAGEESFRTPHGVTRVGAGQWAPGHAADTPMQASSSGPVALHALIMFVVDTTRSFSSPATMP
jgi:hypothetical protein